MKLSISGYQIIQEAELFVEGITMVTGSNNQGKSSIIRAVESCLFSEQGDDFIHDEMGVVQVRMEFDEEENFPKADIAWQKGRGSGAIYFINGVRFAKDRGKPPIDEMTPLGFKEIIVRNKKQRLYFWRLHDALFMVVDHPSFVFAFISNLMEHEKILPVLKDMSKEGDEVKFRLKEIEARSQVYETEIENARLEEERLKDIIDSQRNDIQMIGDGVSMLKGLESFQVKLAEYNKSIEDCYLVISEYAKVLPEVGLLERIKTNIDKYEYLIKSKENLIQVSMRIKNLNSTIAMLEQLEISDEDLSDLDKGIQRLSEYKVLRGQLLVYKNNIDIVTVEIKRGEKDLEFEKETFEKMKKDLGVCPLCGKEF